MHTGSTYHGYRRLAYRTSERHIYRCDKDDINALRLTSRRFHDIATNHLLEEFAVWYNKHSIERAALIGVEHRRLAKNVRVLRFSGQRVEDFRDYRQWTLGANLAAITTTAESGGRGSSDEEFSDGEPGDGESSDEESSDEESSDEVFSDGEGGVLDPQMMRRAYANYRRMLSNQYEIDKSNMLRTSLAVFFSACSNLSQLWIDFNKPLKPAPLLDQAIYGQGLVEPSQLPSPQTLVKVLLAAADARRAIDGLIMGFVPVQFWASLEDATQGTQPAQCDDHQRDEGATNGMIRLVPGLKKLQLLFEFDLGFATATLAEERIEKRKLLRAGFGSGKVISFLRPATDLRVLILHSRSEIDLEHILGDLRFSSLQTLSIARGTTEIDYLCEILLRHKDRLTNLRLSELDNKSRNREWSDLFKAIAGKLPSLRELKLRGTFKTIVPASMEDDPRFDPEYRFSRFEFSEDSCLFEKQMSSYIKSGVGAMPAEDNNNRLKLKDFGNQGFKFFEAYRYSYPWKDEFW